MNITTHVATLYHRLGLAQASGIRVSFTYRNREGTVKRAFGHVWRLEGHDEQWKVWLTPRRHDGPKAPSRCFTFFSERVVS